MMKERFAKLLLGEDMSGSGKGVSTALAISNSITNLCGKLSLAFIYEILCSSCLHGFLLCCSCNLKPPFLGNFGDLNPCQLRRNQCGEEKWSGFSVSVAT